MVTSLLPGRLPFHALSENPEKSPKHSSIEALLAFAERSGKAQ
jgi:hypothetical protein